MKEKCSHTLKILYLCNFILLIIFLKGILPQNSSNTLVVGGVVFLRSTTAIIVNIVLLCVILIILYLLIQESKHAFLLGKFIYTILILHTLSYSLMLFVIPEEILVLIDGVSLGILWINNLLLLLLSTGALCLCVIHNKPYIKYTK